MNELSTRDHELLEAQLRECFGRVAYSHKTHEKCADVCMSKLGWIKLLQIGLSALTTGGLITAIVGPADKSRIATWVSAGISTMLLLLNTYTKESNPGQSAERHKEAAARLWSVRESYLSLLTDLKGGAVPVEAIRTRRDELQSALADLYLSVPRTNDSGFRRAQEALKEREELTFSDIEIDKMLPALLQKRK
ncbi:MAG TPA: SLATT domain-containing protein [Polyangia bacterium]|nr:SLATT domain-containing protein [Polyangia bacterium]